MIPVIPLVILMIPCVIPVIACVIPLIAGRPGSQLASEGVDGQTLVLLNGIPRWDADSMGTGWVGARWGGDGGRGWVEVQG